MINQFRTIDDLREEIEDFERILMRLTPYFSHPTLYRKRDVGVAARTEIKNARQQDVYYK